MSKATKLPIGYEAAAADWNEAFAGRPHTLADWNMLTLGEQQRYGAQECKTKGAIYETKVAGQQMVITVDLPQSLVGRGFTEKEARWLEAAMHKKIEETVHWVLVRRTFEGTHP